MVHTTTEQILEKIKDEHGKSALRDGQSLLGLFQDYSHNQLRPQANALRTFLDCKGNQRILNLCSEPSQKQQTEYHRLIQEMVRDYNMQEATAAEVCAAFWRVAIGTEPPVLQSSPETVKEPMREMPDRNQNADTPRPAPVSIDPAPAPAEKAAAPDAPRQKAKAVLPFRMVFKKLPLYTTIVLVFGFLVLAYLLNGVLVIFTTASEPEEGFILGFMPLIFIAVVMRMQYLLFREKTVTDAIGEMKFLFTFLVYWALPSIMFGAMGIDILSYGDLIPIEDAATAMFGGVAVFSWYHWLWLVPVIRIMISVFKLSREEKKKKRGGKK